MEAFLDRVVDEKLSEQLEAALDLPDPAKPWNNIVGEDADWIAFLRSQTREHAETWLKEVESKN